ncbi:MAG TPA: Sec-independent protein translocase protein TatB [Pseudonocardiaceae bacterium]|jgi:sec-independent protein translocase protein TatB|nr:Sec-independent protein translocase protein TatB [Pseudonocardiaceae bacterium]
MFDISWGEFLVLIVAGLFILGPERLPGAAAWLGRTVRQVRDYATGARDQLKSELGPEFDDLRKPLEDLRELRSFNPRTTITKHLLDATGGYDPREDLRIDGLPGAAATANGSNGSNGVKPNGYPAPASQQPPLAPGERPPFDPDST